MGTMTKAKPRMPLDIRAKAVQMVTDGASQGEVAEALSVSQQAVSAWMHDPRVLEEVRKRTLDTVVPAYAEALAVMRRQLRSDMPWIQQGAARDILTRYHELVTGQSNRDIVITLAGAPVLGMPDSAAVNAYEPENVDISTDDA
jgi:hypothetical protein